MRERMFYQKSCKSFTLFELLLAITLFSIISVSIYSSMNTGLKIYKRGAMLGGQFDDLKIFFDLITSDLHNAVVMNKDFIKTENGGISFYTSLPKNNGRFLYKITYKLERAGGKENSIYRLVETYAEGQDQMRKEKGEEIIDSVKKLEFEYGYKKKSIMGQETFLWKSAWKEEFFPKIIKVKTEISLGSFEKVIFCPIGKIAEEKEE